MASSNFLKRWRASDTQSPGAPSRRVDQNSVASASVGHSSPPHGGGAVQRLKRFLKPSDAPVSSVLSGDEVHQSTGLDSAPQEESAPIVLGSSVLQSSRQSIEGLPREWAIALRSIAPLAGALISKQASRPPEWGFSKDLAGALQDAHEQARVLCGRFAEAHEISPSPRMEMLLLEAIVQQMAASIRESGDFKAMQWVDLASGLMEQETFAQAGLGDLARRLSAVSYDGEKNSESDRITVAMLKSAWAVRSALRSADLALSDGTWFTYGITESAMVKTLLQRIIAEVKPFVLAAGTLDERIAHMQAALGAMTEILMAEYVTATSDAMDRLGNPHFTDAEYTTIYQETCSGFEQVLVDISAKARADFAAVEDIGLQFGRFAELALNQQSPRP